MICKYISRIAIKSIQKKKFKSLKFDGFSRSRFFKVAIKCILYKIGVEDLQDDIKSMLYFL